MPYVKNERKIGKTIKKYRNKQKLTQTELAELLNVSKSAVSNWENGETFMDLEVLEKLATMMKISLDSLIRQKDIPTEYKIYDTVNFGNLTLKLVELQLSTRTIIKLKAKNLNDSPLSFKTFHYQLTDPTGNVFKETTSVVPSYDEWDDDIRTTEKLSNTPGFISSNDEVILELIFDQRINHDNDYLLTIIYESTEVKMQITKPVIKWNTQKHRIFEQPESLNQEELIEIIQFNKCTGNDEENIRLLKKKKELLNLEDLALLGIEMNEKYSNELYEKLTDDAKYILLEKDVRSTKCLVDLLILID